MKKESIQQVCDVIQATLEEYAEKGFEKEAIEAVLHQVEFSQRNQSTQFGLGLAMGFMPVLMHGGNLDTRTW